MRSLTFGCTLALALALAACSRPAQTPGGPIAVVTIVATDYAFAAPDTIPSGLTTFRMVNQGREPHQAVIMGAAGKTWDELQAAVTNPGPVPAWLRFPGSPGVVVGGDASNATARLAPGNYFIVCFIPSADGVPHVIKGMVRRLVVRAAPLTARAPTPTPQSDILVTLSDYSFALSTPLTAGTHTIRVENAGPQLHEVGIEQLAPGKTLADWQQWAAAGAKGVGPTRPVGGLTGPDKGKVGWFTVTLTPGKYLLVCYVPDVKDNKPHIAHGMVQEVTVN